MTQMYEYGFITHEADEKTLIGHIQTFLENLHRTLAKTKDKSLLNARLPYKYKYFYWNLNKGEQVYIEIYPNKDTESKVKFQAHPNVAWIIFVNKVDLIPLNDEQKRHQEKYIQNLLAAANFPHILLHEYTECENLGPPT